MPCISYEYILFILQNLVKRFICFAEKLLKEVVELPETEEVNKESWSLVKKPWSSELWLSLHIRENHAVDGINYILKNFRGL